MNRQQIASWTIPVIVFTAATLMALLLRHLVLSWLDRRIQDRRSFRFVVLGAVRMPSILWCLAAGLAIAIHNAEAPKGFEYWAQKSIGAFAILSIGLVFAAILVRTVYVYGERNRIPFAAAGLSGTLIYIFILSLAMLVVLSELGVQVTPLLTALGVGGLAVALALQDTLANFFAGIHILVEEPISVGDFIELAEGQRGTVRDIGWRTTRIQTFGNNILVIPNQKITSGILTNYTLNDPRVQAEVVIVASHEADPDRVAAIAMEEAGSTQDVLKDPAPAVMMDPGVLPTHLQMKLLVFVPAITDRGRLQSELRMRIARRFRAEGIPAPPLRTG